VRAAASRPARGTQSGREIHDGPKPETTVLARRPLPIFCKNRWFSLFRGQRPRSSHFRAFGPGNCRSHHRRANGKRSFTKWEDLLAIKGHRSQHSADEKACPARQTLGRRGSRERGRSRFARFSLGCGWMIAVHLCGPLAATAERGLEWTGHFPAKRRRSPRHRPLRP